MTKVKINKDSEKPSNKNIGIEEKKIDLNFKPTALSAKTNPFKVKQSLDYEEEKEAKDNAIKSKYIDLIEI